MRENNSSSLPTWQKINYNSKRNVHLAEIVRKILSERLDRSEYINRPIHKDLIKLKPIGHKSEFIILEDDEFIEFFEELENHPIKSHPPRNPNERHPSTRNR
jgi:hypothetical protein